jgi:pimeloyl-ACP methyl ester carboxylesterase
VIGPLSDHHRVFAPDFPGYGQSDKPDIQYTMDYYVTFLAHLLDALHLERVSLVGLTMGGGIALGFALRFPERVEKLVLVAPYGILDKVSAHRWGFLLVHIPFLDELSNWLIGWSRSLVRWMILAGLIYDPQRLTPEMLEEVYQEAQKPKAGKAFISFQRDEVFWNGIRSNFTDRLHEITAPTLLLRGSVDAAVPLPPVQRAHELIKGSLVYIMQECRHWAQGEKPEEFSHVVLNFLDH